MHRADTWPLRWVMILFGLHAAMFVLITYTVGSSLLLQHLFRNFVYHQAFTAGLLLVNAVAYYMARRRPLKKTWVNAHLVFLYASYLLLPLFALAMPLLHLWFDKQLSYSIYYWFNQGRIVLGWVLLLVSQVLLFRNLYFAFTHPVQDNPEDILLSGDDAPV